MGPKSKSCTFDFLLPKKYDVRIGLNTTKLITDSTPYIDWVKAFSLEDGKLKIPKSENFTPTFIRTKSRTKYITPQNLIIVVTNVNQQQYNTSNTLNIVEVEMKMASMNKILSGHKSGNIMEDEVQQVMNNFGDYLEKSFYFVDVFGGTE